MKSTVYRNPDEFAADLESLKPIDWARLWSESPGEDPWEWCEQFGWKLTAFFRDKGFEITLPTGAKWSLTRQAATGLANNLEIYLWQGDDNDADAVTHQVLAQWDDYLAAAGRTLGTAHVTTTWDAPDFPDDLWDGSSDWRLKKKSPYRMAVWKAKESTDPTFQLWINRSVKGSSNSIVLYVLSPKAVAGESEG